MDKTLKNIIYVTGQQLVNTILPFLTIPYIARVLGVEQNGVYAYSLTIATMFAVFFSFGFAVHGANAIAQSKEEEREVKFLEIQILRMAFLFIGLVIFLFFIGYLDDKVHRSILLLQGILILVNLFDISWYYQGVGNFKKIVTRNIIVKLLGNISVFIFVKNPQDLWVYIALINGSQLIGNIILFKDILYTTKYLKFVDLKRIKLHLKVSMLLFLPNLSVLVFSSFDKIFLGSIGDIIGLSNYQHVQRIMLFLYMLLMIPSPVMIQKIASLRSTPQSGRADGIIRIGLNMYLILGVFCMLGIYLCASDFIMLFLGVKYQGAIELFIILSPILITKTVGGVIGGWYLIPKGKNVLHSVPLVLGTAISILLNILFTPLYGVKAAAVIFVFIEFIVIFIQLLYSRELYRLIDIKNILILLTIFLASCLTTRFITQLGINEINNMVLRLVSTVGLFITLSFSLAYIIKPSRLFASDCFNTLKGR